MYVGVGEGQEVDAVVFGYVQGDLELVLLCMYTMLATIFFLYTPYCTSTITIAITPTPNTHIPHSNQRRWTSTFK